MKTFKNFLFNPYEAIKDTLNLVPGINYSFVELPHCNVKFQSSFALHKKFIGLLTKFQLDLLTCYQVSAIK